MRTVAASMGEAKQDEHKRIPGAIPPMPMWSFQQTGAGQWRHLGSGRRQKGRLPAYRGARLNPGHACYPSSSLKRRSEKREGEAEMG